VTAPRPAGEPPREAFAQRDARLFDERERDTGGHDQGARAKHSNEPIIGAVTHCEISERRDREYQREHDALQ